MVTVGASLINDGWPSICMRWVGALCEYSIFIEDLLAFLCHKGTMLLYLVHNA
jgi:hypothetical protein